MKHAVVFAVACCIALPVYADESGIVPIQLPPFDNFDPIPLSLPSHTEMFVIDPSQSYVKAYVPSWEKVSAYIDSQTESFDWELHWTLATYSLAGSFKLETVPSDWVLDQSRLFPSQAQISTDAPSYAAFGLPYFFAQLAEEVSYQSHPCFDVGFNSPPGMTWSCSGWEMGATRRDNGTLQGNVLSLHGAVSTWFLPMWLTSPDSAGSVEPPALPTDYSGVQGLFEYNLVAVAAVPEPETYALMLAGLGLVGFAARSRGND